MSDKPLELYIYDSCEGSIIDCILNWHQHQRIRGMGKGKEHFVERADQSQSCWIEEQAWAAKWLKSAKVSNDLR